MGTIAAIGFRNRGITTNCSKISLHVACTHRVAGVEVRDGRLTACGNTVALIIAQSADRAVIPRIRNCTAVSIRQCLPMWSTGSSRRMIQRTGNRECIVEYVARKSRYLSAVCGIQPTGEEVRDMQRVILNCIVIRRVAAANSMVCINRASRCIINGVRILDAVDLCRHLCNRNSPVRRSGVGRVIRRKFVLKVAAQTLADQFRFVMNN